MEFRATATSPPAGTETVASHASPDKTPTSPKLQTRLHHASDIFASEALAQILSNFTNEGYAGTTIYPATRWDYQPVRFHTPTGIHDMLGPDGMLAAVYHVEDGGEKTTPVAVASVSRWHGDMDGVGVEDEEGWEIKAVTTKSGWGKMGLVTRCLNALTEGLAVQQRSLTGEQGQVALNLWVHAVEEVNGDYWRRRGWVDVRGFDRPVGYWGSRFGFRLSVLLKEVDVQ